MKFNTLAASAIAMMFTGAPAFAADQNIAVNLTVGSGVDLVRADGTEFNSIVIDDYEDAKPEYVKFETNDVNSAITVTPRDMKISRSGGYETSELGISIGGRPMIPNGSPVVFSPSDYYDSNSFKVLQFVPMIMEVGLPAGHYSGSIELSITQST